MSGLNSRRSNFNPRTIEELILHDVFNKSKAMFFFQKYFYYVSHVATNKTVLRANFLDC